MKQKGKLLFVVLLISFIFLNLKPIGGQNVKLIETIKFSPESVSPLKPKAFCVTHDDVFIFPDYQAGNIKIYEKRDNILESAYNYTIGRKGYGPDEFAKPSYCFYNEKESKFVVLDWGIKKIFIYDRIGRLEFKRVNEVPCWRPAGNIQLREGSIFISGYQTDPNPNGKIYELYQIDLTNEQMTLLLPSYSKYGSEFKMEDIDAIGIKGMFDIYIHDLYFIWEGDLRIIKINLITGEINPNTFGAKKPPYVKPQLTEKLIESDGDVNSSNIDVEREKFSYVRNIFVSSKYIIVIYEGPLNSATVSNCQVQFYKLNGDFIKQYPMQCKYSYAMWFDKSKNFLYSLNSKSNASENHYFISKYDVNE